MASAAAGSAQQLTQGADRHRVVREIAAAHGVTDPGRTALIAAGYDVARQWTGPYLVAVVDQLVYQLRQAATADPTNRFVLLTTDDVVHRIAATLAPDFVRTHVLWAPPPTDPAGWAAITNAARNLPGPVTIIGDDRAAALANTDPAFGYLPLLPAAPGARLVGAIHGLDSAAPNVQTAVRAAAGEAAVAVARSALQLGAQAARASIYQIVSGLDQYAAGAPPTDRTLAWWLSHLP